MSALGVQVIRVWSLDRTADPPTEVPDALTSTDHPGSTVFDRSTTILLPRGTSSAPGAGDCEVIAMLGGVLSNTTSTR